MKTHRLSYNSSMNLDTALKRLARDPAAPLDLAEVALTLARDEYPHLDVEGELAELAEFAHDLRPRLQGSLQARVQALGRFLIHDLGFEGNVRDYYDPRNSYLNEVLVRRTGLPITLSIITIAIGTRAGLHIEGVGLPGHFIVKAIEGNQEVFFDPFHGGRVLSLDDCAELVKGVVGTRPEMTPELTEAVTLGYIVQRMLNNLKGVYLRQRDFPRAARIIRRLIQLCPDDRMQQRDLGAVLLQGGRPGQAIDLLEEYLGGEPPPEDAHSVRELLGQARGEVARWN
ncbi:MAG: transglutaminase-like domain-containing protein [Gemmataceae bacterium]